MRAVRNFSLRGKVELFILLTCSVALLLASAAMISYTLYAFRRARVNDLRALADVIGAHSAAAGAFQNPQIAHGILRALEAKEHVTAAAIYDRQGQVLATYLRGGRQTTFVPPAPRDGGSWFWCRSASSRITEKRSVPSTWNRTSPSWASCRSNSFPCSSWLCWALCWWLW